MRIVLALFAWLFTIVGFIGIVVPLLPSTPFFILAVYLFDKSSPHFSKWLRTNRFSGPTLVDWEKNGVIRPRIKVIATLFVLSSAGYLVAFADRPIYIKVVVGLISAGVLFFLLTRPNKPSF